MPLDWFRPLIAGLVAVVVVGLLTRTIARQPHEQEGWHVVGYGRGYRLLAALFVPFCVFVTFAALQASDTQRAIAAIVTTAFWAATVILFVEVYFTEIRYNMTEIRVKSVFKPVRVVAWDDIMGLGRFPRRQSYFLETRSGQNIWVSPLYNGAEALLKEAARQIRLAESPHD